METLYTKYDLVEVEGTNRMTSWLPSQSLHVGDRITLKGYNLKKNLLTEELCKVWWQVVKRYPECTKSKKEIISTEEPVYNTP